MLRVLQVVTNMDVGGIECFLMNLYRAMDRSKIQFDFLEHGDGERFFDEEIRALGGRVYRVPKMSVPHHRQYIKALDHFFATHKEYRIVHSHRNTYSMYILRAAMKAGVPVRIAHSHCAAMFTDLSLPFRLYTRARLLRYCTHPFACGKAAGEWLFGKGTQVTIFPNAIDVGKFVFDEHIRVTMRNELNLADSKVYGHIGNFSPVKNHSFLLEVFKEIYALDQSSVLLLAGEGALRTKMEAKAAELGVAHKVRFLGSRRDIPELLHAVDCFMLPSLFEGFPVTLVEAQASGLPCLVSDSVSPEVEITDLLRFFSLQQRPQAWAEVAAELAKEPRRGYGNEVKEAGYDIGSAAKRLQDFYLEQA